MTTQNVDPRATVLRTMDIPNVEALVKAIQSCVDLQLVFDVKLKHYDVLHNNPSNGVYPRFTLIVYAVPMAQLRLPGVDDV